MLLNNTRLFQNQTVKLIFHCLQKVLTSFSFYLSQLRLMLQATACPRRLSVWQYGKSVSQLSPEECVEVKQLWIVKGHEARGKFRGSQTDRFLLCRPGSPDRGPCFQRHTSIPDPTDWSDCQQESFTLRWPHFCSPWIYGLMKGSFLARWEREKTPGQTRKPPRTQPVFAVRQTVESQFSM